MYIISLRRLQAFVALKNRADDCFFPSICCIFCTPRLQTLQYTEFTLTPFLQTPHGYLPDANTDLSFVLLFSLLSNDFQILALNIVFPCLISFFKFFQALCNYQKVICIEHFSQYSTSKLSR